MKNQNLSRLLILSLIGLMVACGKNPTSRETDPLAEHENLKAYVPPEQRPPDPVVPAPQAPKIQSVRPTLYDINGERQVLASKILNFVEGQQTEHLINIRIFQAGAVYTLKAHNLPVWAKLERTKDVGIWKVTGAPPAGSVPALKDSIESLIQIELVLSPKSTPEVKNLFASEDPMTQFSLAVSRNIQRPTIEKIEWNAGPHKEDSKVRFSVEVRDPSASKDTPPQISFYFDPSSSNQEKQMIEGHQGVSYIANEMKPVQLRNGNWKYSFVYDTGILAQIGKERGRKDAVEAQFSIQAQSQVTYLSSVPQPREIQVELKKETPKVAEKK